MDNLHESGEEKTFYVWVNPNDIYARYNTRLGSFVSVSNKEDNLMFLPNPKFSGYISPFQENLLKRYQAEYLLEMTRKKDYKNYPSRLIATFLFASEEDAVKYAKNHSLHVASRELRKGRTIGQYIYSTHDLGWIDLITSPFAEEEPVRNEIVERYWKGVTVSDFKLNLSEWPIGVVAESICEVLFIGRIEFEK